MGVGLMISILLVLTGSTISVGSTTTAASTAAVSTTTTTTSPSTTERPSPVVDLQATLEEPFVDEFTDRNSTQFRSLEITVITFCDSIYLEAFDSSFIGTSVLGFSPAPSNGSTNNTAAEVRLQFNDSVAPAQLPTADNVAQALVDAVSNPNNTFNVSIQAGSIQVLGSTIPGPSTTTPISTTIGGTTSDGSTTTTVGSTTTGATTGTGGPTTTTGSTTTDGPTTTTGSTTTGGTITTMAGSTTTAATTATGGSTTTGETTTTTTVSITTGGTTTTTAGPTTTGGTTTTMAGPTTTGGTTTAMAGSTTTGPTTATSGSTTTGETTATTTGSTTASGTSTTTTVSATIGTSMTTTETTAVTTIIATTEESAPVVVLGATLDEPFVEEFNDRNSQPFRRLEAVVVRACDIIYFAQYGFLFIRTFVIRFRTVSRFSRTNITAAEVGLEFNRSATPAQLPTPDAVAQTLVDAVSTPNSTFNLSVQANSIEVLQTTIANVTTASPAVTTTTTASGAATTASGASTTTTVSGAATTASGASTTTTVSGAATTASGAATTASGASVTTATTESLVSRQLSFRSVGETFTTDLLNTSSEAFIRRATLLTSTLSPFYQAEFPSFRSFTADSFSNGSIINNATLEFVSTSVPNNTAIGNVLIRAASNITAFNIDTSSISVGGTQVSSGVSHKISLVTASCLVLLSWLLSCQQ